MPLGAFLFPGNAADTVPKINKNQKTQGGSLK